MLNAQYPDWRYHFAGVGGIGMSALAQIMADLGYRVSGSDNSPKNLKCLAQKGIEILAPDAGFECDLAILTRALPAAHPIWSALKAQNIDWLYRGSFMAQMLQNQTVIAVGGTHGKTTTTALIAEILLSAGVDPSLILGGMSAQLGTNYRIGKGPVVVEADESDASFLELTPVINVITNIDDDHLQTYNGDIQKLEKAFEQFAARTPFFGLTVAEVNTARRLNIRAMTFGIDEAADFSASNVRFTPQGMTFTLTHQAQRYAASLPAFGWHNVSNALAAIATCYAYGIEIENILAALQSYRGVKRRLEAHGEQQIAEMRVRLYEDYGHHPVEVQSSLTTLKAKYPDKELVCVFEPHRYTRSVELFAEFVQALRLADVAVVAPIYAAGESALDISNQSFAEALGSKGFAPASLNCLNDIAPFISDNAIVVLQGAGPLAAKLTQQDAA